MAILLCNEDILETLNCITNRLLRIYGYIGELPDGLIFLHSESQLLNSIFFSPQFTSISRDEGISCGELIFRIVMHWYNCNKALQAVQIEIRVII